MDLYQLDEFHRKRGYEIIAGLDEAGRGPLAGPVVAAAVIFPKNINIDGLRDSKKVPVKKIPSLFWEILSLSKAIGIGIVDHEQIDRLNILKSTKLAMKLAIEDLSITPALLIIDAVTLPSVYIEQISTIKAESKSASVAAASIVAKYVRDSIMIHYHELYPIYNFKRHKGYCTKEHVEIIRSHGPSPIHRKSFKKVMSPELPF
jgi:ribonuclease HII